MSTKSIGAELQGADEEARSQAASLMGKARTEKKISASRANVTKAQDAIRGKPISEDHKAKLREAQRLRREREKAEWLASGGSSTESDPKRKPGRPKKTDAPQEAYTSVDTPGNGT